MIIETPRSAGDAPWELRDAEGNLLQTPLAGDAPYDVEIEDYSPLAGGEPSDHRDAMKLESQTPPRRGCADAGWSPDLHHHANPAAPGMHLGLGLPGSAGLGQPRLPGVNRASKRGTASTVMQPRLPGVNLRYRRTMGWRLSPPRSAGGAPGVLAILSPELTKPRLSGMDHNHGAAGVIGARVNQPVSYRAGRMVARSRVQSPRCAPTKI